MSICKVLFLLFRGLFVSRGNLILENLALRQQLTVQQRTIKRPKLKNKDRIFWSWLSQIWPDWKSNLIIVKPETVIKWHRQGFRLYWRWKSRTNKVGRPRIPKEIRNLALERSEGTQYKSIFRSGITFLPQSQQLLNGTNNPNLYQAQLLEKCTVPLNSPLCFTVFRKIVQIKIRLL